MIKYFSLIVILASIEASASFYPACDVSPIANVTHFSVEEVYDGKSDSTNIQVENVMLLRPACVLDMPENGSGVAYIDFSDTQSFLYDARPVPRQNYDTTIAKYAVQRACPFPDGGAYMLDRGYFNAIPSKDPMTREMIDYVIDDGVTHALVYAKDNLEMSVTMRDTNHNVVAVASRTGMKWEINNPGQVSVAHISFVLIHKLNSKNGCWTSNTPSPGASSQLGFWPSIGIAVAVTAVLVGGIVGGIAAACKYCKRGTPKPYVPLWLEMQEEV